MHNQVERALHCHRFVLFQFDVCLDHLQLNHNIATCYNTIMALLRDPGLLPGSAIVLITCCDIMAMLLMMQYKYKLEQERCVVVLAFYAFIMPSMWCKGLTMLSAANGLTQLRVPII